MFEIMELNSEYLRNANLFGSGRAAFQLFADLLPVVAGVGTRWNLL